MEKSVKEILNKTRFGFKKRLGQNFITDKNLLSSIVKEAGVSKDDVVVEIGCGAGTLTRALAEAAGRVIAYEVDRELQPVLRETLSGADNAEVIFRDFLKEDIPSLEKRTGEFSVVANLPYYITTPLIIKVLEESTLCKSVTVMVQEEVADRLVALSGTPEYGAITAIVAYYASAKIIKKVPRELFFPRPNVDSAVVKLQIERGRLTAKEAEMYKKAVHAAFLSRRKTLVNNLMAYFNLSRTAAEEIVKGLGVDIKARGETLSPELFSALSDILPQYIKV